jgi:hypothetical protein
MMQTSAMKACFQIAECSKSSAKVIRIFDLRVFLVNLNAVPVLYLPILCLFLLSSEKLGKKVLEGKRYFYNFAFGKWFLLH